MAYGRKRSSRRYSSNKKYGKKYGRKRYSKKKFYKNNINQLTMKAPLAARLLRVKLPWAKTFVTSIGVADDESFVFQGNGIVPYTLAGQTGTNDPAVGDSLPAGEVEYSTLYDKYFINGSSIKVEALNINGSSGSFAFVRAVLLAVPFATGDGSTPDTWFSTKAQLDSYSYSQLLAWPYAKWRMLGANTGGASRLTFKMFRKTKSMCGLKDLRDNREYGASLTDGLTAITGNINPQNGFMYYLRFFQAGSSSASVPIEITVRMSLYVTMTNREFNPVTIITTEP